jgi:S-adenosylmethionine hydrolase
MDLFSVRRWMEKIITLTTDFGTADGYVGAMKGVILSLAPDATVVDISHDVPPQAVRHGARLLATAVPYFPTGTVHVAVVDPGVGSARRGIALQTPHATFVGPDNGLFSPFVRQRVACFALSNPATHYHPVSVTFHGRDIFAPVAAHLVNGLCLTELGPPVEDPLVLPEPEAQRLPDGRLRAQVVYVDRFGNLVMNVRPHEWAGEGVDQSGIRVAVGNVSLTVRHTYADVAPGTLLALVGSSGYLEVAVCEGSAAERLGVGMGATVEVWGL